MKGRERERERERERDEERECVSVRERVRAQSVRNSLFNISYANLPCTSKDGSCWCSSSRNLDKSPLD